MPNQALTDEERKIELTDTKPHDKQPSMMFTMLLRLVPSIVTAPLILQLVSVFLKKLPKDDPTGFNQIVIKEVMLMFLESSDINWLPKLQQISKQKNIDIYHQ